ncbi:TRAP transporter substrate-binding protein [Halalkalicoccus tibetensis]|uniref:TRAP transporter substrate-binding protein n=1 Tax=Halalkalicoccus tibetensis TaxID=175632 RepID=A0ABD5V6F8_9EURY
MKEKITRRGVLAKSGIAAVTTTGLAGCLGDVTDDTTSITLASSFEPGHINVEAAEIFGDLVEEESDGNIEVDVSAGGSYGAEDEIAELVSEGSVEGSAGGALPHTIYIPEYSFFMGGPYVIEDFDHMLRVMDSDLMDGENEELIEAGNQRRIGNVIYRGWRQFTSNVPVRTPDDLGGINLRYDGIDSRGDIFEAVGVDPVPVPLDELYSALQQGTVDASEGDVEQIYSFNLFEVQDYLSLTEHLLEVGLLYLNEDVFQGLDESEQDLILELAEEATDEASEIAEDREEDRMDELADEGMEIVEDVEVEAFRENAQPAIEDWFESAWVGSYDEVQDI